MRWTVTVVSEKGHTLSYEVRDGTIEISNVGQWLQFPGPINQTQELKLRGYLVEKEVPPPCVQEWVRLRQEGYTYGKLVEQPA